MKSRLLFVISLYLLVFTVSISSAAELLSLVPADASLVMNIQFQKIAQQPELVALFETSLLPYEASFKPIFEKAGIDPLKQVYNVLFFMDKNDKIGVLADGSFDAITTCEFAQSDPDISRNFTLTAIGNLPALRSDLNPSATVVFVDQRTMAIGDVSVLEQIGDMVANKSLRSIKSNRIFSYMLQKLDTETPQLWGIGVSGKKWLPSVKSNLSGLDHVRATYFALNYDKEFTLDSTSLVTRASQLQELIDSLDEFIDGLKSYVSTVNGMEQILNNAVIQDNQENLVRVVINMPTKQFDSALRLIWKQINR